MGESTYTVKETHKLLDKQSDDFTKTVKDEVKELKYEMQKSFSSIDDKLKKTNEKLEHVEQEVDNLNQWKANQEGNKKGVSVSLNWAWIIIMAATSIGGLLVKFLDFLSKYI